jgi:hypothetical protein
MHLRKIAEIVCNSPRQSPTPRQPGWQMFALLPDSGEFRKKLKYSIRKKIFYGKNKSGTLAEVSEK